MKPTIACKIWLQEAGLTRMTRTEMAYMKLMILITPDFFNQKVIMQVIQKKSCFKVEWLEEWEASLMACIMETMSLAQALANRSSNLKERVVKVWMVQWTRQTLDLKMIFKVMRSLCKTCIGGLIWRMSYLMRKMGRCLVGQRRKGEAPVLSNSRCLKNNKEYNRASNSRFNKSSRSCWPNLRVDSCSK